MTVSSVPNCDFINKDLLSYSCDTSHKFNYDRSIVRPLKNVLLTGGTGFLGQNLLVSLLSHTSANIYCLVRVRHGQDAKSKLRSVLINSGCDCYDSDRIIVLSGDLNSKDFGLSSDVLDMLKSDIDAIYHCGAYVHHLHTYQVLRNDVLATCFLIKLSITGRLKFLHFVSTMNISGPDKIWEPASNLLDVPFCDMGYIQVKWTCEKILYSYILQGYPFFIYRPGNITGHSKTGYSIPYSNHALLLVKGFIQDLRAPNWDDVLEMTPVDLVSMAIVKLSMNINKTVLNVFNLHNPTVITWREYLAIVSDILDIRIEFVDRDHWRTNILPNIDRNNAIAPFRKFYSSESNSFSDQPVVDEFIRELLLKIGIAFPGDYRGLIKLYLQFLLKIKFINLEG